MKLQSGSVPRRLPDRLADTDGRSASNLDLLAHSRSQSHLVLQPRASSPAQINYPGSPTTLTRTVWVGIRDRPPPASRPLWPVWLLAAATVFIGGFKVGLNVWGHSNVIDVGYAGPIGAQRIVHGQSPYGHFPVEDSRPKCPGALADREGEVRERIQTNGRCESANPNGDTYGPMSYIAYIGYACSAGRQWDKLRAAHFAIVRLLCLIGLAGGVAIQGATRVTLAFAWATSPVRSVCSNSNSNDASCQPSDLGILALTSPGRAASSAGSRLDEVRRADRARGRPIRRPGRAAARR